MLPTSARRMSQNRYLLYKMKNFRHILIITVIFFSSSLQGQITKGSMNGIWESNNEDSLFFYSDTIKFVQNINQFVNKPICNTISWEIEKGKFKQYSNFKCTEPGRKSTTNSKQKVKLRRKKQFDELHIKQGDSKEVYRVISYKTKKLENYPHEENILMLLRKDKIQDQRLHSVISEMIRNDFTDSDTSKPVNYLIVLDGVVLDGLELLKNQLLYDVKSIKKLDKKQIKMNFPHSNSDIIVIVNLFR